MNRRESDGYIYDKFSYLPWSEMQAACKEGAEMLRDFCERWEGVAESEAKRFMSTKFTLPSNYGYVLTWAIAEGYVRSELVDISDEENTVLAVKND